MTRLMIVVLFAFALNPASPIAALAQTPTVRGTTVKIQDYPGIGNMLFRVAASKGFCEKYGVTCQLQLIASAPLGAQALLAKSIDVGFLAVEVQINAMLKGANLKAILSGGAINPFMIIVRNDIEIPAAHMRFPNFMAYLKGRKIGVTAHGSAAELQFGLLVKRAGFSAADFTFVAVGAPDTSYGALISKQIDASMTFEPAGSMCDVLQTCKLLFVQSEASEPIEIAGTNGASTNLVVTQEMAEKAPNLIDALIAAAKDAEAFLQDPANFNEALDIAKAFFRLAVPRADEIMSVSLARTLPTFKVSVSRAALKQISDNMLATRQIDMPFDTTRLVHAKAP